MLALLDAGHEISLVVTQPDRKRSRGSGLSPSPVKAAAIERGLAVATPERAIEVADLVRSSGADLAIVVAFGQLLPKALLDSLPLGFLNLHFSLLPRWRGAAPVERAILADDPSTGVCVMLLDEGLDTGPVYARETTAIRNDESAGELTARLVTLGTELLLRTLPLVGVATPDPQTGEPQHASKLSVDEFRLDLMMPPDHNVRVVRAGNPRPGAWIETDGKRLKVLAANVVEGAFVPTLVQPAGKPEMPFASWKAGNRGTDPFVA